MTNLFYTHKTMLGTSPSTGCEAGEARSKELLGAAHPRAVLAPCSSGHPHRSSWTPQRSCMPMQAVTDTEEEMEVDIKIDIEKNIEADVEDYGEEEMEVDMEEMVEEMEVEMEDYVEDMEVDEKDEEEDMVLG